jgi:hypothetical protein
LDVPIEIVGGFEVKAEQSDYKVEVSDVMLELQVRQLIGDGSVIGLMPLAHELIFNLLRNRPDRYVDIASQMRTNPKYYLPALNKLLLHNTFSIQIIAKINALLDLNQKN